MYKYVIYMKLELAADFFIIERCLSPGLLHHNWFKIFRAAP